MNENNISKSSHSKKDVKNGIILSEDSGNVVIVGSKSVNVEIHKPNRKSEMIKNNIDKGAKLRVHDDADNKSLIKLSVKMNNCDDNSNCDIFSLDDISQSVGKTTSYNIDTCDKMKSDKVSCPKICHSCINNVIKCKSREGNFHVSIKSERPLYCCKGHKIELNCDVGGTERHSGKHGHQHNGPLSLTNESKGLKLDVLFQFLHQMRQIVLSTEPSLVIFRVVTERLIKDKLNIELLLLIEVIVRTQVVQMSRLISLDLFKQKVTPAVFVITFMKQYQFLRSLSQAYKEILSDYESSYLASKHLSFDLICRTYFKLIISECPRIKDQLASGYLNLKIEKICGTGVPKEQRDKIRANYATMKSDFQDTEKWKDIDKTIKHILNDPDDIVKSLVNYFNNNFTLYFPLGCHCKNRNGCDNPGQPVAYQSDGTYKDLIRTIPNLPERDSSIHKSQSREYRLNVHNKSTRKIDSPKSRSSTEKCSSRTNHSPLHRALENIKSSSNISRSSSNNSNGYNSCLSISSFEESSDEDHNDNSKDIKLLKTLKRTYNITDCTQNEETTISVSVSQEHSIESSHNGHFVGHHRCKSREMCQNGNQGEVQKNSKLYKQYITENEFVLENDSALSSTEMSVPEYLDTLEKADDLQSIIKVLMTKFKKDLDTEDEIHYHSSVNLSGRDSGYHHCRSTDCIKPTGSCCPKHKDTKLTEKDFEIDFEELLKTFGVDTSTRENLEEFEKFLEKKLETDKDKIRPNLEALVKNCRIYCKKLYNAPGYENVSYIKSTIPLPPDICESSRPSTCCEESFDVPYECPAVCSKHKTCLHHNNSNNNNNSNTSININISSSDTCINNGAGTDHSGNNRVCNCCKCEMFGEQSLVSGARVTNVADKLRIKLQKRKQFQQKQCQSGNRTSNCQLNVEDRIYGLSMLPDVDSLVDFINGAATTRDVQQSSTDNGAGISLAKKSKVKVNKPKPRKITKSSMTVVPDQLVNPTTSKEDSDDSGKINVNRDKPTKQVDSFVSKESPNKVKKLKKESPKAKVIKQNRSAGNIKNQAPEKEVYDQVVEDFKRFCSQVIVPEHRKKLPIDASILIGDVERRLGSSDGV